MQFGFCLGVDGKWVGSGRYGYYNYRLELVSGSLVSLVSLEDYFML